MATGSCLCGTVQFSVSEAATDMSHCHCSICRKFHGSLFATYYNATNLKVIDGKDAIATYESSPGFTRTFCNRCGSPLPEQSNQGDEVFIPAGIMDDDPGVRPTSHIFVESKADAYTITDDLPQKTHYGDNKLDRVVDVPQAELTQGVVSGGCLCGKVTFEYSGEPLRMMNCHCSRCRKVKGAAHASNVFVSGEQFRWRSGEKNITDYAHEGAEFFGHAFCKSCGSSVPRPRPDGSLFNIPAGSLDEAPGDEPLGHIYVGSKAPWYEVTDDKPQWQEMPE